MNEKVAKALNEQIGHEFSASNHYLGIATYFAKQSLLQWADFFFKQSAEEHMHGMKILNFLIDNDASITLPAIPEAKTEFTDALEAVTSALNSEKNVSKQFDSMAALTETEKDFRSRQFLEWFIAEQVEEEATMNHLIDLIKSGINLFQAQQFLPAIQNQQAPTAQ